MEGTCCCSSRLCKYPRLEGEEEDTEEKEEKEGEGTDDDEDEDDEECLESGFFICSSSPGCSDMCFNASELVKAKHDGGGTSTE